jgi:hypothetical protein
MADHHPDTQTGRFGPSGELLDYTWDPYQQYILPRELNIALAQFQEQLGAGDGTGGIAGGAAKQYLTVGSNELPPEAKAACDYQCDGVDDQVQINAALARASRSLDGFGGEGYIGVALVGPRFYVANNNTTAITMYPSTHLTGTGPGTIITPMWSTAVDRGCIELLNDATAHVHVSNLTIGRHNAVQSNGHGIKFIQSGDADNYEFKTGSDPYIHITRVNALMMSGSGFYITGLAGGARETQISHCLAWTCAERGFFIDSSDCQISDCRATGGGNFARFEIAGGNTKIANCKAYFSGNRVGDGTTADGFWLSSSRISITACDAQDCGRYGFNFTGSDVTASALVADSNSNKTANGGGFFIAAKGMYSGLNSYNRPQTPAFPQNKAFILSGNPQVYLTGRAGLANTTGGVSLTGTAANESYVRIVQDGSTIIASGGDVSLDIARYNPTITAMVYTSGNLTSWTENGVPHTATYNADGSMATLTVNGVTRTFSYDADGNMTGAV